MVKRLISIGLVLLLLITAQVPLVFAEETEEVEPKLHYFTGRPVEEIPESLLEVDSRGGELIPLEKYDFSSKDAEFDNSGVGLVWTTLNGQGFYRITVEDEAVAKYVKSEPFDIKPNRQYLLSILIWMDFSRYTTFNGRTREMNLTMSVTNSDATKEFISLRRGMPDYTDGWQRLETVLSPGLLEAGSKAQLNFATTAFTQDAPESAMYIADFKVYELPEKELVPYKEGEGMVFRGGAGELDMRVEGVKEDENTIVVDTTGACYTFNTQTDTISAEQKISKRRKVSEWKSSVSLEGLKVRSITENEAVITNSNISFGVQLDGTLFLTPHKGDARLVCTSKIGGIWNRLNFGYLMALDDYGGFTVTPDIPAGTGKTCNYEVLTEGLDFPTWEFSNAIVWGSTDKQEEFNTHISNAKPGWQIAWTVSPGERLAITTFPPREYDWDASFTNNYINVYPAASHYLKMQERHEDEGIGTVAMWGFLHHGSGMEYGRYYLHDVKEDDLRDMIKTAHAQGVDAITYTSAYFYYNREEPTEYINEVARLKEKYGIDGVYSDGTPSESQWITAYEEARMLRELFPSGTVIVHQTGQPANGGPPLSSASYFLPMVDTYFTGTLKGENIGLIGESAPLPYVTWNQHNIANCIGIQKGDYWNYENEKGELVMIPQATQDLLHLIHNGRARVTDERNWINVYYPILKELKSDWEKNGDKENYYEAYFAPLARKLCHEHLAYLGDLTAVSNDFENENPLKDYSVSNVNTEINDGTLKVSGKRNYEEGSIFKKTMSLSGSVTVEYDIELLEAGDYEQRVGDDYGTPEVGLMFSKDGKIKLKTSDGGYTIIGKYSRNALQKVKLLINTDTHKLDVYVNDACLISDMNIDKELFYIGSYEFFSGGYGTAFTLDNFKVSYRY